MKLTLRKKYVCVAAAVAAVGVSFAIFSAVSRHSIRTGQGGFETAFMPIMQDGQIVTDGDDVSADMFFSESDVSVSDGSLSYSVYRVKSGDMIGVIAEQFGLTQDTIISVNNIRQSRLLQIGQYLKIPSMPGILYTVREDGEVLDSVAQKYRISAEKCAEVNNVSLETSLSAGTTLFLPEAELDWVTRQEINGDLFSRPLKTKYYFSSYYGWRQSPFTGARSFHSGIDMAAPRGTPVYAALSGTVVQAGWSNTYGNYVQIKHHSGYQTLYGHLDKILVSKGAYVYTTTKIGLVGSSGLSTGNHLHFTVYKNGKTVNPQNLWN